ncbi:MAG: c-type cytochrome [Candidatus Tectomicrobia bacterium]|uniref:C-type cytochrome n=1 Tax=Tectimicrobiota bacterium TaxID=2528274 RepID=A0A932MKP7_UNCTE|nr:c-type cytochrome [Candidatus Tectomicrobia bacterium]
MKGFRGRWVAAGVLAAVAFLPFQNPVVAHAETASKGPALDGERLIRDLNCAACHQLGKGLKSSFPENHQVGPDLSHEGEKVRPEWLFDFLKDPRPLRPGIEARMPKFRLSDEAALGITLYLSSLRPKGAAAEADSRRKPSPPSPGHLAEGKKYFDDLECAKCHFPPGQRPAAGLSVQELGPDLGLARARLNPDWVLRWLKTPQAIQPGTKMPNFFYDDAGQPLDENAEKMMIGVRDYVMQAGEAKPSPNFRKALERLPWVTVARGRELMVELNCVGCHPVEGLPKPKKVGPALAFEGDRVKPDWLAQFLREPRVIRPMEPAAMPDFRLSGGEAAAVAEFIAARWKEEARDASAVGEQSLTAALAVKGKSMWEQELGCSSCHRFGEKGSIGGPILTGLSERLNPAWLFRWVKDPKHFLPNTPMPRVPLTDDEAKAIVAYLFSRR